MMLDLVLVYCPAYCACEHVIDDQFNLISFHTKGPVSYSVHRGDSENRELNLDFRYWSVHIRYRTELSPSLDSVLTMPLGASPP